MQFRDFFFVLSTSLIATLSCQSSSAFTLTQNRGLFNYISESELPNGKGYTSLNVLDPDDPFNLSKASPFVSEIKLGGRNRFLENLRIVYGEEGWTFKKGQNLKGSFNVKLQYPCGIKTNCGQGTKLTPSQGGIGSALSLIYRPGTSKRQPNPDPKNS